MNAKHRKTLEAIFAKQTPKTLPFRNIESLLVAVGCRVIEGDGSRVQFKIQGEEWLTHRPHPQKIAKPYQVKDVRNFLSRIGIEP